MYWVYTLGMYMCMYMYKHVCMGLYVYLKTYTYLLNF